MYMWSQRCNNDDNDDDYGDDDDELKKKTKGNRQILRQFAY